MTSTQTATDPQLTDEEADSLACDDATAALDLDPDDLDDEREEAEAALNALGLAGDTEGAVRLAMARDVLALAGATPGTVLRVMTPGSHGACVEALLASMRTVLEAAKADESPAVRLAALAVGIFAADVEGVRVCRCCRAKVEGATA